MDEYENAKKRLNKTNKKPAAAGGGSVGADGKPKHKLKMKMDCLKMYLRQDQDFKWLKYLLKVYLRNMLIGLA